jgi:hypothetical protein
MQPTLSAHRMGEMAPIDHRSALADLSVDRAQWPPMIVLRL